MKTTTLLNAPLSSLVSTLGHRDEFTIADCGLPIPATTKRIDLALIRGVPTFMQTVEAILSETRIETVTLAQEFPETSPELHDIFLQRIRKAELPGQQITLSYISHQALKEQTAYGKAVIRTGECTPYANAIFGAGVAF